MVKNKMNVSKEQTKQPQKNMLNTFRHTIVKKQCKYRLALWCE